MSKTKINISGKKAYIAPVSYCLKVNGNNICVASQYTGNHTEGINGGDLVEESTTLQIN